VCHTGEFSTYTVKDFRKLIGKDVIAIHHLLKNDIPLHEYWLITDEFFQAQNPQLPGLQWERGVKSTENGAINFQYSLLSPLKEQIQPEESKPGIKGKRVKMMTLEKVYKENIHEMFAAVGDISHRPSWVKDLRKVDKITTPINRVGTSHHCILDKQIEVMTTSDFQGSESEIIMEETDGKKMYTMQFHLTKVSEQETHLAMTLFLKKNILMQLMFSLFMKNKFRSTIQASLDRLDEFLKTSEAKNCCC
jgi:hypothetical protein